MFTTQAPGMTNFQLPAGGYLMPPQFSQPAMQAPQVASMQAPDMRQFNPGLSQGGPISGPTQPAMDDLARLRQERALQNWQRTFGTPHRERFNTPMLGNDKIAEMILRIRAARGM